MSTKVYGDCECGEPLFHHSAVKCKDCTCREHPGSSRCPFCMEWYYTHSGSVVKSVMWYHAKKECLSAPV
jgi:hypothetical protein